MNQETTELQRQLLEVVGFYRGILLDSVEQALGEDANWKHVRSRLLKCLGDSGLEGRIREIINNQGGAR
jgi:hypothetical protein